MKKKLLAIFLCLSMIFASGVPGVVAAEETETSGGADIPAVSFTKVAPLVEEAVATPTVRKALKAAAQANDAENKGDVFLNKTVTTVNGTTKIRLEVYSTGSSTTTVTTEPVDIVLVLDVSGSMDDNLMEYTYTEAYNVRNNDTYYYQDASGSYQQAYYCSGSGNQGYQGGWYTEQHNKRNHNGTQLTPKTSASDTDANHTQFYTRSGKSNGKKIDALKSAVNAFIDNVNAQSPNSKIAIVKFASDKSDEVGNDKNWFGYNYSQIVNQLTNVDDAGKTTLKNSVNALQPAGATRADYGMQHALSIIQKDDNKDSQGKPRKKVVVMFTDGQPTSSSDFENGVANAAIAASKDIKDTGATVYTIGCFSGANGSPSLPDQNTDTNKFNRYMHLVSSNFPNATSLTDTGTAAFPDDGKSYYLSAASHSDLMDIFTSISQEVGGTSTELTESTVVRDIVTPYFTLPEDATKVTLKTAPCIGKENGALIFGAEVPAGSSVTASIDEESRTVSVTGFNFKEQWCGTKTDASGTTTYRGNKLIIEFEVTPRDGFLGGNGVPTNGENSGVYVNDKATEPVKKFDPQQTDVTIGDITFETSTNYTYLGAYAGNTVTKGDMTSNTKVTCNGVEIDLSKADQNYGLEEWQNAYVDIKTTLTDEAGNVIPDGGLSGLYKDTKFNMTVTITPTTSKGDAKPQTKTVERDIKVFLPHVTFKDSTINLGEKANYQNNFVSTKWKTDGGVTPEQATAEKANVCGDAPTLTFTYDPVEDAFTTDMAVKVTVSMPGKDGKLEDVTDYVTFYREACTFENCTWKNDDQVTDAVNFVVHVKSFDLTITKTVDTAEPNQTFLFHIKKDGQNYMDVTVQVGANGKGSVTVKGLPVGNYTVTEDTAWSWRYVLQDARDREVDLSKGSDGVVEVQFENKLTNGKWLSGETACDNRWNGNQILKNGRPLTDKS